MVQQYPHTGKSILPGEGTKVNADYIPSSETIYFETPCRFEPNTGSQVIDGMDGNKISFIGIVYMPLPGIDIRIKPETLFEVWDGTAQLTKRFVKQFSKGQLNMRVWLG